MTSIGSNVASSSKKDEPSACAIWVSLTLEEQLTNIKRIICKMTSELEFDATYSEDITRVVKQLRTNPWANIENILWHHQSGARILLGTTPLHWAVLMDDSTMVHFILTSGKVYINASTTYSKNTALIYAIIGGNQDIVEDLLKHKADVRIVNHFQNSALYYMVCEKDSMFDILKTILANNVNICDDQGNTTLHYAAKENATDIVAFLIDQKADVNLKNEDEETPLHIALKNGFIDVVKCLLQQNVDVNVRGPYGQSPLHYAALFTNDMTSLLMEHNANVDALDEEGRSSLLLSISLGRIDSAKELIELGANVHIIDKWKNNNLHKAIQAHGEEHNMMDIVKLLRERDVDVNAKNSKDYSPFFAAVATGQTEVVKELLQSKEKIKLMEECDGQTAIQIAYDHGHEHIKIALLECNDVSRYVDDLYRDRQVYVDAANAILVGAALIASVTFASWLQPPLGYTTPYSDLAPSSVDVNYVDVQHNASLRAFWIFNTLSFYFSIGTVVFGARSVLPRQQMFIKTIVVKLHRNLLVTSILLACSVFFVIIAFGIAGCIVLTPTLKFQWYMIVPTIFGGVVCLISLGFLFKSIREDNIEKKREKIDLF